MDRGVHKASPVEAGGWSAVVRSGSESFMLSDGTAPLRTRNWGRVPGGTRVLSATGDRSSALATRINRPTGIFFATRERTFMCQRLSRGMFGQGRAPCS